MREYLAPFMGYSLTPYRGYKPEVNPTVDLFFSEYFLYFFSSFDNQLTLILVIVAMRYGHSATSEFIPFLTEGLTSCPFVSLQIF